MDYKNILYVKTGNILSVTFNRPEKLNALDWETIIEIDAAITAAEADDDVKVVILKGAGQAFSSGADLTMVGHMQTPDGMVENPSQRFRLRDYQRLEQIMRHLLLCNKVTIAQVHGQCLAWALLIAVNCDLIISSESCRLGFVEERLTFAGVTMSPMLVHRVGLTQALGLSVIGDTISGTEAADIKLVNWAFPDDRLESEVDRIARRIALCPKNGLAIGKATRHALYDLMGMPKWFTMHTLSHVLVTYVEAADNEFDFRAEIKKRGPAGAAKEVKRRLDSL